MDHSEFKNYYLIYYYFTFIIFNFFKSSELFTNRNQVSGEATSWHAYKNVSSPCSIAEETNDYTHELQFARGKRRFKNSDNFLAESIARL